MFGKNPNMIGMKIQLRNSNHLIFSYNTLDTVVVITMAFRYLRFYTTLNFKESWFSSQLHTLPPERLNFSNARRNPNTV